MNRRTPNGLSSAIESLTQRLEGYLEIQLVSEAKKLMRQLLRHPNLDASGLSAVVGAIGIQMKSPGAWRHLVENAYNHIPAKEQRRARPSMLNYYYLIWDPKAALSFYNVRDVRSPADLLLSIEVLR